MSFKSSTSGPSASNPLINSSSNERMCKSRRRVFIPMQLPCVIPILTTPRDFRFVRLRMFRNSFSFKWQCFRAKISKSFGSLWKLTKSTCPKNPQCQWNNSQSLHESRRVSKLFTFVFFFVCIAINSGWGNTDVQFL